MSASPDVTPDSHPPSIRSEVADPDVAIRFVVLHAPGDARADRYTWLRKAAGEAPLTPEMCHVGLRQCLGIDDGQLADHRYPITGPDALAVFKG